MLKFEEEKYNDDTRISDYLLSIVIFYIIIIIIIIIIIVTIIIIIIIIDIMIRWWMETRAENHVSSFYQRGSTKEIW